MRKKLFAIGLIVLIVLSIIMNYRYYENKKTEVFLIGKVIGFEKADFEDKIDNSGKNINTSSSSIGTMTFIKENYEFAALGHPISKKDIDFKGECYEVDFLKFKKSSENKIGRIIASIDKETEIGYVSKNSKYGVFGTVNNVSIDEYEKIETENRYKIKKGTAYILIDFDGTGLEKYEVEIEGMDYLALNQNIELSVKSQKLIEKTGGIVQGMSGAPIIQNGKLIGAINCVDRENPLNACGIFIDKLV